MSGRTHGASVGVGIGPDGLIAVAPGTRIADPLLWSAPLAGVPREGTWPELEGALGELRARIGSRPASLDIALLPAWSAARVLEFPRLRPHELSAVLQRDARRYFLEARGPQVAAAEVLGPADVPGRVRVLAAVASETIVEAIFVAGTAAGWRVRSVVPAHAAWGAAAQVAGGSVSRLLVVGAPGVDVIGVRRGRIEEVRRLGGIEDDGETPRSAIVGDPGLRRSIAAQLGLLGVEVEELPVSTEWADSPAALAAAFAGRSSLRFVTPRLAEAATRRVRGATFILAAAAAVLLGVAGVLELWGAGRELAAVRARRQEIAPIVREVAKASGALRNLDVRFATLRALEGSAPQWPVVVTLVAQHLPADARLTAFRAEGDSLLIEGEARRAGRVFDAMGRVPGVVAVRTAAPVRREFREGAPPVERFVLTARLGSHASAVSSAGRRESPR